MSTFDSENSNWGSALRRRTRKTGLMNNSNKKRPREDLENDEEDTEIIISFLSFLMGIVGAWYHGKYLIKEFPMHHDERAHQRELWMRSLSHSPTCFKQLRVNIRTFNRLCDLLCNEGGLIASKNVTIQEIVALFLYILGHDQKNSTATATFVRSGETISRQFHTVLRAVLRIGKLFLKQQCDQTTIKEMLRGGAGFRMQWEP
ncbi:hypothetical protein ACS0TY_016946 [Phlomoides rotata]